MRAERRWNTTDRGTAKCRQEHSLCATTINRTSTGRGLNLAIGGERPSTSCPNHGTALCICICIREVDGSSLCQDTECPERGLSCLPSDSPEKCLDNKSQISSFLPDAFQFIIHKSLPNTHWECVQCLTWRGSVSQWNKKKWNGATLTEINRILTLALSGSFSLLTVLRSISGATTSKNLASKT
jgi:hypothetical protein